MSKNIKEARNGKKDASSHNVFSTWQHQNLSAAEKGRGDALTSEAFAFPLTHRICKPLQLWQLCSPLCYKTLHIHNNTNTLQSHKKRKGAAITIILHIPTRTPPLNELISVCGQNPTILTHLFLFCSLRKKAYHMAIIWNRWHLPNGEAHCLSLQFRALHFRSETAILRNNYLPGQQLQLVKSQ